MGKIELDISWEIDKEIEIEDLANIFINLQNKKANNINLVSPTPYIPQIIEAIKIARELGVGSTVIQNAVKETDDYESKYKEYEECTEKNKKNSGSCTESTTNPSVATAMNTLPPDVSVFGFTSTTTPLSNPAEPTPHSRPILVAYPAGSYPSRSVTVTTVI